MHDRIEKGLKLLCAVLVALLIAYAARTALRTNPLKDLKIPEVPSLPGATNSPPATNAPGAQATNAARANALGTNALGTNALGTNAVGTNAVGTNAVGTNAVGTNAVGTNAVGTNAVGTNAVGTNAVGTNAVGTNAVGTNAVGTNAVGTNAVGTNAVGTNVARTNAIPNGATLPPGMTPEMASAAMAAARGARISGMPSGMSGRSGQPPTRELPPLVKARVDKIIDSELLGPVPHPVPMGLIGIAGDRAMLRSTNGQEGIVKVGEDVGGLKLLKIGTNRVLVEQNGQKSELMIFNGFGGETLLPKEQDSK